MSMGKRIAEERKRRDFSQEYIAEKLDVSRQAVSKWEQDLNRPDTGNLIKLAELFHVSVEYLCTGGEPLENSEKKSLQECKRRPCLMLVTAIGAVIHLVFGILGKVNIVAVITVPVFCAFFSLIVYAAFSSMHKSGHYDMLAGFGKKRNDLQTVKLQMYWFELLSEILSLLLEIIFVLTYFTPETAQMRTAIVLFAVYISAVAVFVLAVNMKIKSKT